jgi:hypothetical protein
LKESCSVHVHAAQLLILPPHMLHKCRCLLQLRHAC